MARVRLSRTEQKLQINGGLFNNADNITITGGNFTSERNGERRENKAFRLLQRHVAAAAFHNSKQRLDPPRCHKDTRQAILEELFEWIVGQVKRDTWIAWLNGAAGSGKSAICQSIAEICIQRGIKVASFFLFRNDRTRNSIDALVATLAYQIILLIPETKEFIIQAIETNPLLFKQKFETQLNVLIVQPLQRVCEAIPISTLLVIIDGVDECEGNDVQMNMIDTIARILRSKHLPLVVLFASRCEYQIQMAFNSQDADLILKRLPLDDNYQPDEDIRRFLTDSFDDLKRTHPFLKGRHIHNWPPPEHVQEIVTKSSGQFIYASVVIKFLSMPTSNPQKHLDIIRGLRPAGRLTPFAQLDALYRHLLSRVDDLPMVLDLLAYKIFSTNKSLHVISHFFQISVDDAISALASLVSVIYIKAPDIIEKDYTIYFRHASLPDFLRDKSRSQEYCINSLSTDLSILWFQKAVNGHFHNIPYLHHIDDIAHLLDNAAATANLRTHLMNYNRRPGFGGHHSCHDYLASVRRLNFGDGGEAYRHCLLATVRFAKENRATNLLYSLRTAHDLSEISILYRLKVWIKELLTKMES